MAHEPGRSASINLRYRDDPRFFGPLAAFNGGSMFGLNFMLRELPKTVPFDTHTLYHGGQRLVVVATCLETGKPAYFEKGVSQVDLLDACRASASLPLLSTPVRLGKLRYLDGGCSCPIPLAWAKAEGFAKTVVIATRHKGFRKAPPDPATIERYDDFYGDDPLFLETLLTQELRYDQLMDELDALEEAGEVLVLRPAAPVEIGRFEKDTEKLLDLYNRGRREMRQALDALGDYLAR